MFKSVVIMIAMFGLFFISYVQKSEGIDLNNAGAVSKQLDFYRENGSLASRFVCDGGKVSVTRYSAVNYSLLVINNETAEKTLFIFNDTQEALAGGQEYSRQYFKRFVGDNDAANISEKEFITLFEQVSPNFYRFVVRTQHVSLSDMNQDTTIFENDCRAMKVAE